ncbi:hypothetical protein [Ruminococcus sp.]|uniref:hypothetical protein n=1 Tax=Ruminococcus sp. TaxID=41978 RepID=UPI0025D86A0F|nr:hypothetical protein [Ruminococcus sp.]MBQ8966369.1 hypothetical protein [Ruminococcus sp.]
MKNTPKSTEEIRAQYKKDKRKPMSVRAHTKLKAITALFSGLFFFYMVFSGDVLGMNDKEDHPADIAVMFVLMTGMLISGFIWLMNLASYKMEPDDEMSARTRDKANGVSFFVWYLAVFPLLMVMEKVKNGSVSQLLRGSFYLIFISGLLIYDALRHFMFLMLDKPDRADEEE